jgi:hypothetical protein
LREGEAQARLRRRLKLDEGTGAGVAVETLDGLLALAGGDGLFEGRGLTPSSKPNQPQKSKFLSVQ